MVRRRGGTPGGYDPGGGSDDSGIDASDPSDAPSARGGDTSGDAGASISTGGSDDRDTGDDDPGFDAGDPRDAPSARGSDPVSDPATIETTIPGSTAPDPGTVGGDGPGVTLDDAADAFTAGAETVGDAAAFASPATELDRVLPGEPVRRTVEGVNAGAIDAVNPAAAAQGIGAAADRVVRDTRRANQQGAAGRRQNRQELAADTLAAATGFAGRVQEDPVGALSRTAGGAVGGTIAGSAVARSARSAARGSSDVDVETASIRGDNSGSRSRPSADNFPEPPDDITQPTSSGGAFDSLSDNAGRTRGGASATDSGDLLPSAGDVGDRLREAVPDAPSVRATQPADESLSQIFGTAGRTRSQARSTDSTADPVPSGRSQVGGRGVGSILDEDTARALQGRDTSVDRSASDATPSTSGGGGDLPLRDPLEDAGGVRRLLDEQRAGLRDFVGDDRGQLDFGRPRSPDSDTGPRGGTDRVSDGLVQDSLERQQRAGRSTLDEGDFEGVGDPFGRGSRAGDFGEDRFDPVDDTSTADAGGTAGFGGFAGGLGGVDVDPVNDPSGITDFSAGFGSGALADSGAGSPTDALADGRAGGDVRLGILSDTNDATGIRPGDDTTAGGDTDTTGDMDVGGASATPDSDTELLESILVRESARTGTQQRPGQRTAPAATTGTVSNPETAGGVTDPDLGRGGFGGFGDGGGPTPPRRGEPRGEDDDEDELPALILDQASDQFASGIASAEDFLGR